MKQRSSMDATDSATDGTTDVCWSRSPGLLSGAGKADVSVKTWLSEGLAERLTHEARLHGMTTSEFLRVLVAVRIDGLDALAQATTKQLFEIAGVGPEKARE